MRFQPKTEQDVAGGGVWPAGEVDFEILEAAETVSKTDNDMIKLRVRVYNAEGRSKTIFDYLVATEGGAYKVRHFAEAVGMLANYERGELYADDLPGKAGRCKLSIRKSPEYGDQNQIQDYVKPSALRQAAAEQPARRPLEPVGAGGPSWTAPKAGDLDDELPF
jgi:hypothetical protein